MPEDDVSRRFEDIESKLEELEDLELTNQIEILEIKTLLEELEPGESVAVKGKKGVKGTKAAKPPPKEIVKAVENLYKIANGLERKVNKLHDEIQDLKKRKPSRREASKREAREEKKKPKRAERPPAGDLEVTDIRSKLDKAREIMRRD